MHFLNSNNNSVNTHMVGFLCFVFSKKKGSKAVNMD